ncbi:unnamed protein product [Brassica rapa]|uniref:MADS-box domain-containing protein n=1 Tax=Brassica campestris TaxID=3711 RepID=A0A8D9G055_BRACM|nr:unnamed protein product [Brassica rapa]
MKKARELSVLCDVPIGLIIFSRSDKLYSFCSQSTSMEKLIMRYQMAKEGHATSVDSFHPDHGSYCEETKESMMREIENLKMNLQFYGGGHNLNLLTYDDLLRFQLQLECSLQNARARKKVEPSHMFGGVKHASVHRAVDKLRLFLKNHKFNLFIGIIFSDDEQVNPKSRASTVLAQQLAFKSDNKRFKVAVSE